MLATRTDGSLVAMVMGAANRLALEHDYPIREWEAAGLDKPSIARLDRIAEIPAGCLGAAGRIGPLVRQAYARMWMFTARRYFFADATLPGDGSLTTGYIVNDNPGNTTSREGD